MPPTANSSVPSRSRPANSASSSPPPSKPVSTTGKRGNVGSSTVCPACQHAARFVEYCTQHVRTVNGDVHHAALGLDNHWSPTLLPVMALAPFAQAVDIWQQVTGLRLATETCRRRTEAVGNQRGKQHLTDGGNGLERVLRTGVSSAVACVLDWWHLSEKLHDLGGHLPPWPRRAKRRCGSKAARP